MSTATLAMVKADLRETGTDNDTYIQLLIDAAEDECLQFLNISELPTIIGSSEPPLVGSVYAAVFLLVRAKYDSATPDEIQGIRKCAEMLLMPYRGNLGM